MTLFQSGSFVLHSGAVSPWKIECEALTPEDWETLAQLMRSRGRFRAVEGVPRGGLRLAAALQPFATGHAADPLWLVDDVLSTGRSMETCRAGRADMRGLVVFARGPCPSWVVALWHWGLTP